MQTKQSQSVREVVVKAMVSTQHLAASLLLSVVATVGKSTHLSTTTTLLHLVVAAVLLVAITHTVDKREEQVSL